MIRVHIFVEGQTEETFVRDLLVEHFSRLNIYLNPILVKTGKTGKGGIVSYEKIKRQIEIKCKEDQTSFVTTMFDLYGLPGKFPGMKAAAHKVDIFEKVKFLEHAFSRDINHKHFIPNFLLHEFEALLFSSPSSFFPWFSEEVTGKLSAEGKQFPTPEHINDNPNTAPSKRILHHIPGYQKPVDGNIIALSIGLDHIRKECAHFNHWLQKLEQLPVI